MTAHLAPDELTTLDDLKRAIDSIPALAPDIKAYVYQTARAEAWRTAFQWRDKDEWPRLSEYVNGMALIREKLR